MNKLSAFISLATIVITASPAKADIFDANVYCKVAKIRKGQLAIRHDDKIKAAFGGLNNGDKVQATGGNPDVKTSTSWYYVKVLKAGNSNLVGREGIVNSSFLSCDWHGWDGSFRHQEATGN